MSQSFNVDFFKNRLTTSWLGSEFIHFDEVDSTNNSLKAIPSESLVHGTVIHADHQNKGRGQYDHIWHDSAAKNLTFTIAFCPDNADRAMLLTLACAKAVAGVLEAYSERPVHLKWPNDLMISGRKVGGILTECIFLGSKTDRILLGIGINVFEDRFNPDLQKSAISLAEISKDTQTIRRELLLAECLSAIEKAYTRWHKQDPELSTEVSRKLIGYGEWVCFEIEKKPLPGRFKFLGISAKGELIALNEDLDVNTFSYEQIRIITGNKKIS